MPMTSREMQKLLLTNGFELIRTKGTHLFFENKVTGRTTVVPNHAKDLKKD